MRRDEELAAAGLRRPLCARAELAQTSVDRATALLEAALADCMQMLDEVHPDWRARRVGLVVGTSSGGMRAFEAGATGIAATYAGPVAAAVGGAGTAFEPASIVLAACASSVIAIGIARTWLEDDRCDLVLAGGFDAVSVFVAAGFESLRATCSERGPWPFRRDRDGLALGEGAAVLALTRDATDLRPTALAYVTGFAASCDAHHLTAPDPTGTGLFRAARGALVDAGEPRIGLISGHGTATQQNDAAEAHALARLTVDGDAAAADGAVPVFSLKGTIGHTLGAAGALETLATIDALARGVAPATAGEGPAEPGANVLDEAAPSRARTALKLGAAFGGANAALVVTLDRPAGPTGTRGRRVFASRAVVVEAAALVPAVLAARSGYAVDRIARADDLVRWALAAVAALAENVGPLRGAGIVVGLGLATVETNTRFRATLRRPEPRRFPYTTPNAAAGECAVAFGLDGPAFAVGGGPHGGLEAIAVAADLVRAGVADRIVVVAADEAGEATAALAPGTRSGAVALVVQSDPADAELERWSVSYAPASPSVLPPMDAHRALLPLVDGEPTELTAAVPWGGAASLRLHWTGNAGERNTPPGPHAAT